MNNVRLISYTEAISESYVKEMNVEGLIAYCARVSNPSNQNNEATARKLIKYLIKHKHWSPLEMVNVCLEIETTRDIGRQILRHRSFSFQEFSQRYADPTKDLEFVTRECRLQDDKNRQNSIELNTKNKEHNACIQPATKSLCSLFFVLNSILFCLFLSSCSLHSLVTNSKSFVGSAYL